ncbi:YggT family protein [Youngiibacter multivorans]|uniref:Flagellar biogenesis protein FliO n=1 Tax=Youngiibacter multivorans TaxID=937251 RepID=A0ABS4FZL8_9CLOT|nr:YggT family protein [Youngiibacter multivorans]MBP1917661.1 flagellar biogenesis protein FliO [Youngiibacter multivorans]
MVNMTRRTETHNSKQESHMGQTIIGIVFGVIEILLAFRLGFKLLGANPGNDIVRGIYSVTQYIVGLFEGIFPRVTTDGIETTSVFEPSTAIAMLVVALIAWGVMKLIKPRSGHRSERTEYTDQSSQDK